MNEYLQKQESALLYEPAPAVSKEFRKEFNKIVPMSPNGVDRMLRFVWGCDRKEYIGGANICRYGDLDHTPPKYQGRCRWILEGWQPAEIYDKKEWHAAGELLGEYPRNGYWDFVYYHVDAEDAYLPLDESALEVARSWAWWQGQGQKRSVEHLMEKKVQRRLLQDMRDREAAAAVATKFGEDVIKEFEKATDTAPAFSMPGAFERTASGILLPKN